MTIHTSSLSFPNFNDAIDELNKARTISGVEKNCRKVLSQVGVSNFKFLWEPDLLKLKKNRKEGVTFHNCPVSWVSNYAKKGYGKVDPKLDYCRNNSRPVIWREQNGAGSRHNMLSENKNPEYASALKSYYLDFKEMRMGNGVLTPLSSAHTSFSMFCVSSSFRQWTISDEQILLPWISAYAQNILVAVERISLKVEDQISLSKRERDCVQWTACGLTASEVSAKMGITERTVLYHLNNAKIKLGAVNKPHLAARAVSLGLIEV